MKRKVSFFVFISIITLILTLSLSACSANGEKITYQMDINLNITEKTAQISGSVNFNLSEKSDSIDLVFNANVFSTSAPVEKHLEKYAYPNGVNYGKVEISCIKVGKNNCEFELNGNILKVKLPKKYNKGKKLEVFYDYTLKIPFTTLRYGYNNTSINMANFYPQVMRVDDYNPLGDPFYSEVANYDVNISVDKNYKVLASGDLKLVQEIENNNKHSFSAQNARDFAFVASNVLSVDTQVIDDITVNYMYNNDAKPKDTMNVAIQAIATFNKIFGKYPNKTLNICEVDFVHGGMEFAGLIYIARNTKDIERTKVVVHEIAHQWWYGMVGSDQINHSWQDEGLTEFSVYLYFLQNNMSDAAGELVWNAKQDMQDFEEFSKKSGIAIDGNMDRSLGDFLSGYEYVYSAYIKGFLMHQFAYELMGEKKYLQACKEYVKKYNNQIATPQDMFNVFDKEQPGISMVYQSWLGGKILMNY